MTFSIDALPSVICHWRADSLSLSDGDNVTTWNDSSSNAVNMTAAPGAYPIYKTSQINGLPCVRFDGSTSRMTSTVDAPTNGIANPGIVAVLKIASNKNYNGLLTFDTVSPASGYSKLAWWSASAGQVYWYGTGFQNTTSSPLSWFVYDAVNGKQQCAASFNGLLQGATNFGAKLAANYKPTLGFWPFSGSWYGGFDLAEVVVFNETNLSERFHIAGSLAAKYAITLNADHPFYAGAPTVQPGGGSTVIVIED